MGIGEVFARKFPRMLTVVILLSFFHVFVFDFLIMTLGFPGGSVIKNLPAVQET